jgi:hypothetical protein
MAPLVADAADEVRNFDEITEGCGPVGNGEAGVVAGDESSGGDDDEGGAGREYREGVVSGIVFCRDGFQGGTPWAQNDERIILAKRNVRQWREGALDLRSSGQPRAAAPFMNISKSHFSRKERARNGAPNR